MTLPADENRFKPFPGNLIAWQGFSFLATDVRGDVVGGLDGFYYKQTRFLSKAAWTVDGAPAVFVSANPVDPYSLLAHYLAGPESALAIQLDRFAGGGLRQDLALTNHGPDELRVALAFDFQADFADTEEVVERDARIFEAPVTAAWDAATRVLRLTYEEPRLDHATEIRFDPEGPEPAWRDGQLVLDLRIGPRQTHRVGLAVVPIFRGEAIPPAYGAGAWGSHGTRADRVRDALAREATRLETPNRLVQATWDRAVADLAALPLLDGDGPEAAMTAAGIPLYQEHYGRDSLTTAWQASLMGPTLLAGALKCVGSQLGTRNDPAHDERPGRVIQQAKESPLALLGANPFRRYYGDYAGPAMFLIGAAWHYAQTGDVAHAKAIRPQLDAVLRWVDEDADLDGDGLYEYDTCQQDLRGKNQGWMDSPDALVDEAGAILANPIACCEVQGYYFAAKLGLGLMDLMLGEHERGLRLLREAGALKRRFNEAFWLPEERCFAQALDAAKRPVRNVASNMGQALASGIVDADKAAATAGRLMAPDMFTGWGIRTLASSHRAFHPFSYHRGTVWPSENATIALGFKRYGLDPLLHDLARGMFDAAGLFDGHRLPEALGGLQRGRAVPHPGIYPRANAPQSWSASAIVLLVQALAGIVPLAPIGTLLIDPVLPDWLPELTLHDVPVGQGRVTLQFKRDLGGSTDWRLLDRQGGPLRVLRQPPPDSLTAGLGDRVVEAVRSLVGR